VHAAKNDELKCELDKPQADQPKQLSPLSKIKETGLASRDDNDKL
jgi:hypothetical protein